mgnify:CR=1 FL=1
MKHESIRNGSDILAVKHYLRTGQRYEPLTVTCACCCERHHPDDMAKSSDWNDDLLAAAKRHFLGPICNGCADEVELCHWCETRIASDEFSAMNDSEELHFCGAACMADWAGAW